MYIYRYQGWKGKRHSYGLDEIRKKNQMDLNFKFPVLLYKYMLVAEYIAGAVFRDYITSLYRDIELKIYKFDLCFLVS